MANCIKAFSGTARTLGPLAAGGLLFFFSGIDAQAGQVALAWDASTSANVGGYKLAYGQRTGNYTATVDVGKTTSYTLAGLQDGSTYYFAVKAYDSNRTTESGYSNEVSKTLSGTSSPGVAFTATPTSGGAPLSVSFTPQVTGTVTSWKWDFGDGTNNSGSTGTVPTAVKSYTTAGTFTATLTVTGPSGTVTKTAPITVSPVANFTASTASGTAPLAVNFTDGSTGKPTAWNWNFGDNTTSTAQNPAHTYNAAGTYTVSLKVAGGGQNSANTATRTITVSSGGTGGGGGNNGGGTTGGTAGLVAAYGFDEGSGATAADASGKNNHGAISGAAWAAGKFGKALSFNGSNNQVTVKDSASLDLTNGLTLEAWVNPKTSTRGRTVILKEKPGGAVYNLYSSEDAHLPLASVFVGDYRIISSKSQLPLNQWSHLATTYDGKYQRLYVNGKEVASRAQTGSIQTSGGALKIGGNGIWGEWFSGAIDEVRIYNRALAVSEIQADMNKSVASSNPPQAMLGQEQAGMALSPMAMGTAKAFQTQAAKTGVITKVSVYVDGSSQAGPLVAGIYSDSQGHPDKLLATATLRRTVPGKWNEVALPATRIGAGVKYWVAVLSPNSSDNPIVNLPTGSDSGLTETSGQTALTELPATWSTGAASTDGSLPAYGAGY
jgi:PKD repeat protein